MPDHASIPRTSMCHGKNGQYVGQYPHSMCENHRGPQDVDSAGMRFEMLPVAEPETEKAALGRLFRFFRFQQLPLKTLLVPKRGLEPLRLASLPPQGSASTSSATWAGVLLSVWPAARWLPAPRPDSGSERGLPPAMWPVRRCWLRRERPPALPLPPVWRVLPFPLPACWSVRP